MAIAPAIFYLELEKEVWGTMLMEHSLNTLKVALSQKVEVDFPNCPK